MRTSILWLTCWLQLSNWAMQNEVSIMGGTWDGGGECIFRRYRSAKFHVGCRIFSRSVIFFLYLVAASMYHTFCNPNDLTEGSNETFGNLIQVVTVLKKFFLLFQLWSTAWSACFCLSPQRKWIRPWAFATSVSGTRLVGVWRGVSVWLWLELVVAHLPIQNFWLWHGLPMAAPQPLS